MLTRLVVADNHPVIRSGVRTFFKNEHEFEIVGEAVNGEEAVSLCEQLLPDLALLDISMPKMNGIEATRIIKERCPGTKVAVFSSYNNPEYIIHALKSGASAYLLKDEDMDRLPLILKKVLEGESYISPDAEFGVETYRHKMKKEDLVTNLLTSREKEILQCVVEGKTAQEIAHSLKISARTVETHKYNLMKKLNTHDTPSLVRFVLTHPLISGNQSL
ncbi:MAG: response regulator transcription factor [SAR324 cluster bacterium]|nr:response regulator transcription factor [SAR324 cluster bacterium]